MAGGAGFALDGVGKDLEGADGVCTAGAGGRDVSSARVTTGGSGDGGGAILTVVARAGGEAVEGEAVGGVAGLAAAGEVDDAEEGAGIDWVRVETCGSGVLTGSEGFALDGGGATAAVAEGVTVAGMGARGVSSARVTTGGAGAGGGAIMIVVVAGIDGGGVSVAVPADGGADWVRAAICGSGTMADEEGLAPGGDGATAAATNGIAVVVTGFGGLAVIEDIDVEEETGA